MIPLDHEERKEQRFLPRLWPPSTELPMHISLDQCKIACLTPMSRFVTFSFPSLLARRIQSTRPSVCPAPGDLYIRRFSGCPPC